MVDVLKKEIKKENLLANGFTASRMMSRGF